MRGRLPLLPTLMVVLAVPVLVGLGVWQLQRAEWKAGLLAELARNINLPEQYVGPAEDLASYRFRNVELAALYCPDTPFKVQAGRNLQGEKGYSYILLCKRDPDALGWSEDAILVNAGWAQRPDVRATLSATRPWPSETWPTGLLVESESSAARWVLILSEAQPPLVPSAPPGIDTISNNHRAYAIQWFSFATILAAIYGLWLRRWLAQRRARP